MNNMLGQYVVELLSQKWLVCNSTVSTSDVNDDVWDKLKAVELMKW